MLRRKHKHREEDTQCIYSGAANTVKVIRCRCGVEMRRELTPAGGQQVGWWLAIFPDWDASAVCNGVEYGLLPYPFVWTGVQPDGTLGRLLTQDEALEQIEQWGKRAAA